MPVWMNYKITAELLVIVKDEDGRPVAYYKTHGSAEASSNEAIRSQPSLLKGIDQAMGEAGEQAQELAKTIRSNERKRLGYKEGQ